MQKFTVVSGGMFFAQLEHASGESLTRVLLGYATWALVAGVLDWYAIDEAAANATWPSLFMQDTELAWLHGRAAIDDL